MARRGRSCPTLSPRRLRTSGDLSTRRALAAHRFRWCTGGPWWPSAVRRAPGPFSSSALPRKRHPHFHVVPLLAECSCDFVWYIPKERVARELLHGTGRDTVL